LTRLEPQHGHLRRDCSWSSGNPSPLVHTQGFHVELGRGVAVDRNAVTAALGRRAGHEALRPHAPAKPPQASPRVSTCNEHPSLVGKIGGISRALIARDKKRTRRLSQWPKHPCTGPAAARGCGRGATAPRAAQFGDRTRLGSRPRLKGQSLWEASLRKRRGRCNAPPELVARQ
jgi:hypothetical protein